MADSKEGYFVISEKQVEAAYRFIQSITANPRDATAVTMLVLRRLCSGENMKNGKDLTNEQIGAEVVSLLNASQYTPATPGTSTRQ